VVRQNSATFDSFEISDLEKAQTNSTKDGVTMLQALGTLTDGPSCGSQQEENLPIIRVWNAQFVFIPHNQEGWWAPGI
jgi:hypothetical protein